MTLRLAISSCLLGNQVRWNAGHKRDAFLGALGGIDWVPFCPEDAVMGTPRPTIRLERKDTIRAVESDAGTDHTDALEAVEIDTNVHGIILKRASPTCGLDVAVWQEGKPKGRAPGVVAAKFLDLDIPITEEGRLGEPGWREHFFDQAFCWMRWEALEEGTAALHQWHARHKLTLMAHDPHGAKELGRLAAAGDREAYRARLPGVLKTQGTRGRHANVLQHIQGYFDLDAGDAKEMVETIGEYQDGIVPLEVPITLLRHHLRRAGGPDWLLEQTYLNPYPKEWMLRS